MITNEMAYLDLLFQIRHSGEDRDDRTGVGTRSIFAPQLKFDLTKGFPAITTKFLAFKPVLSELLWFLEGSGNERRLAEILYGLPRDELDYKNTIWTANAVADYWLPKAKYNGDLGRVYGVQWRSWRSPIRDKVYNDRTTVHEVDQIAELIHNIRMKPFDRRHIITAWNPGELDQMALPPCHMFAQFYVGVDKTLSCHMYQRSADMFLGVPFNIASYALLTHMIAQVTDLTPKYLTISFGDAHIYHNHFDAVDEQLNRGVPNPNPTLWINPDVKHINDFQMSDFKLLDYKHMGSIKAPMAV